MLKEVTLKYKSEKKELLLVEDKIQKSNQKMLIKVHQAHQAKNKNS